jgi:transketolase
MTKYNIFDGSRKFLQMASILELESIATQVRRDIVRMVNGAASGHPGGPMGAADFLVALYFDIMKPDHAAFTMDGKGEDLFFLSNGHLSAGWYSVLARYGYFNIAELATFRKLGSRLQGHPAVSDKLPGIRMSSGSLGQGLSVAIGAAIAKRLNGDKHLVYCLLGDGELQEGQNWEALMFAAARKVDNLVAVIDYNGKQIDGPVDSVLPMGDLAAKFEAFGWKVFEMYGTDIEEVIQTTKKAQWFTGQEQPVMIIMTTRMGYGVDFMTDNHEWHGVPPTDIQAAQALSQLSETIGDY